MTTFNVMIDDLGRIALPSNVRYILNACDSGSQLTVTIDLNENGRPYVSLTSTNMKTEMPKEEEIIYNFVEPDDRNNTVKISKEQLKLLDWLCDNDYIREDVEIGIGCPSIADLTK